MAALQTRFMLFAMWLVGIAACYSPTFGPCEVRCRLTNDCPSGFACLNDNFCHQSTTDAQCPCKPLQCSELANPCGDIDDTCGGITHCGECQTPQICGAATPNVCGVPGSCTPKACAPDDCGPSTDSCGNPRNCPGCPLGKKCSAGKCVACTPHCVNGELACGDNGCGQSCGACPDQRWQCATSGVCCIRNGQQCNPTLEGCNCCEGLFCVNGICQPDFGCNSALSRAWPDDPGAGLRSEIDDEVLND